MEALASGVDGFSAPPGCDLRPLFERARRADKRLLAVVPATLSPPEQEALADAAVAAGADALFVDGAASADGTREIGRAAFARAPDAVDRLRGRPLPVFASGGVHDAADALALLDAGAFFGAVDSGLVFSGPGLPKRINEALLARLPPDPAPDPRATASSWFRSGLLGAGMLIGSLIALASSATRVVLPYDEHAACVTRDELARINDRLLDFMRPDRVTLAGTMITIAVLYCALAAFRIRRGHHWARVAVLSSALAGFSSFFLFLGFGYFDPFHAFVTAILFQLFALGVYGKPVPRRDIPVPTLREDGVWRASLWGQLLLVAHDRATFGGMLVVSGVTFLMFSLWGLARGARWLWWALLAAGLGGFAPAFAVHYAVGYSSHLHLAPAWAGLGLSLASMVLLYPYLADSAGTENS
jgi:hypothetical protein